MKTIVTRKDVLAGLDLTSQDHGLPSSILTNAHDLVLANGRAVKRQGFAPFGSTAPVPKPMQRTLIQQGRSYKVHQHVGTKAAVTADQRIYQRWYKPMGYAFMRWAPEIQPTRAASWSLDFRLYTGDIDEDTRPFWIWDHASDDGATTWAGIGRTLGIYLDVSKRINVTWTEGGGAGKVHRTVTGTTNLNERREYHIGVTYSASPTPTLTVFLDGASEGSATWSWFGSNVWWGEDVALPGGQTWPALHLLNPLYVRRALGTAAADNTALYPQIDCAATNMGLREIRFWQAVVKDYASAGYPRNRPLNAAEIADANLTAYWPCDDGGGGFARNLKSGTPRKVLLLVPGAPAFVPDTGFSTGLGIEIAENNCLFRQWLDEELSIDPVGVALLRTFGTTIVGGAASAASGVAPYSLQIKIRTNHKFNTLGFARNNIWSVRTDLAQASFGTTTAQVFLDGTNKIVWIDNMHGVGAPLASPTVLADDTVYVLTFLRSANGSLSLYVNTSLDTTQVAPVTYPTQNFPGPLSLTIGSSSLTQNARCHIERCGHFRMEFFRFWTRELTNADVIRSQGKLNEVQRADPNLIVNVEVRSITGDRLPSYSAPGGYLEHITLHNEELLGSATPLQWDAWPNSHPPFFGSLPNNAITTFDPVGAEGACEAIRERRAILSDERQLLAVNHGALCLEQGGTGNWSPQKPHAATSIRDYGGWTEGTRTRLLPAAERVFVLSDKGETKVWTGSVLSPLGIEIPATAKLPGSVVQPAVAASNVAAAPTGLEADRWYSYLVVYRDDAFNVVAVVGPTLPVKTLAAGTPPNTKRYIWIGGLLPPSSELDAAHWRPIRRHSNPRVTSVELYRTKAAITAADAVKGPFFYANVFRNNSDWSLEDTLPDSGLFGAFDLSTRFRPPQARYAELFSGQLILAHFAIARDGFLRSIPGQLETFNINDLETTEDGTGGVITGIKTAYGRCFIFKNKSIHQLVDQGQAGLIGDLLTTSVGCVAPGSLVEFFAPNVGARLLFFWSAEGPVAFNGAQFLYLGQSLKGQPVNPLFAYLDHTKIESLYAVNVEALGQVWVFAIPLGSNDHEKVLAWDYINNRWMEHTGLRFSDIAPISLPVSASHIYLAGDRRGRYYQGLSGFRDGSSPLVTELLGTDVDGGSSINTLVTTGTHDSWIVSGVQMLRGLVLTVLHANGVSERRWIRENTKTTVDLEKPLASAPAPGDTWFVSGIDFLLEVPWDFLDSAGVDKAIHYLLTHGSGALFYRAAYDWAPLSGLPAALASGDRKRIRTYLNRFAEVVKLEVSSPAADTPCELQAFGYEVGPTFAPVRSY